MIESSSISFLTEAYTVLRIPLFTGSKCGVKDIVTGILANRLSSCSISGVCRCSATLYALKPSLTSGKWVSCETDLPAPETPDFESAIMDEGSIRQFFNNGTRDRTTLV